MKCFHCKLANHLKPSCEKFNRYKEGLKKAKDNKSEKTTLGNSDSESNFSLALTVEVVGKKQTATVKPCVSLFDLSLVATEEKQHSSLVGASTQETTQAMGGRAEPDQVTALESGVPLAEAPPAEAPPTESPPAKAPPAEASPAEASPAEAPPI